METYISAVADFSFKGRKMSSFGSFGIFKLGRPIVPPLAYEKEKILGVDGEIIFVDGYKNIPIIIEIVNANPDNRERYQEVKALSKHLQGKGELFFSDDESEKYTAQVLEVSAPQDEQTYTLFTVQLDCLPLFSSPGGGIQPGGSGENTQGYEELKSLIEEIKRKNAEQDTTLTEMQQKNTAQDAALDQKRDKAVKIEETDLSAELRQKVNAPAVTPYDDTVLKQRISAVETKNSQQDVDIAARRKTADKIEYDDLSTALKQKVDVAGQGGYDDSAIGQRLSAVEQKNSEQDAAIAGKVNREAGKGLSEANFTQAEKQKLAGITTAGGYNDEELRNRISAVEQKNNQQDVAIAQRREKAVKITESDLAPAVVEKLGKGEKGDPGPQGPPGERGLRGYTGTRGKSAYEVWRDLDGNAGKTEQEFIESLRANLTQEQVQALTNAVQNEANVKKLKYEDGKLYVFDGDTWHETKGGSGGIVSIQRQSFYFPGRKVTAGMRKGVANVQISG
ncbi:MAG: hypothetical protein Q4A78_12350 [Peptostreptococcaceae bacterium]|nr:hypothetical protein [Peptostreptococcaceae bacterium]